MLCHSCLAGAQEPAKTAIDELLEIMSGNSSLELRKVIEMPARLQGKILAIAEFDERQQTWDPMAGPQEFGRIAENRIEVLGYEVGQDGFVEARYVELTDRRVVSYTGVTQDRRLSVNLYDDENDGEHIILQVRIGPQTLKYLIMRPSKETQSLLYRPQNRLESEYAHFYAQPDPSET
jgi:hypothetical protein